MEQSKTDDKILMTGMAGIFPNSKNLEEFYTNLHEKKKCGQIQTDWKIFVHGFTPLVGRQPLDGEFDAGFFGVTHKHADEMHPSCRKLLELSVEAVMDSGMNPMDLKGSRTGVFVASAEIESKNEWVYRELTSPNFSVFGTSNSLLAARISYYLQLEGPVVNVDSACASSMYALEQAVRSMLSGRCDNALVCGLNYARNPNVVFGSEQLGILNSSENGNVFDESCNGFVKSEATIVIFLQKLQEARRTYAEILNVKTNSDGFKEMGIMHPSADMITSVLRDVYAEVGVDPTTVSFVECHITGTKIGTINEVKAVEEVFCLERKTPLPIGSLKANIGHCEFVSGLASLIKILLGLQHNCILPNPDFQKLKPGVDAFENGRVTVPTERISLPTAQNVIIGCSNFGFGGTNGHLAVKHHYKALSGSKPRHSNRLVCFSARTMSSLTTICNNLGDSPTDEYLSLLQNLFKDNVSNHPYRGYAIINQGKVSENCLKHCNENAQLCLVYPQGTKEWLSLLDGFRKSPVASEIVTRVRNVLLVKGVDVFELWSRRNELDFGHLTVATVAFQITITDVLKELVQVSTVMGEGFSSGLIAAAYAKEILGLDDALHLTYELGDRLRTNRELQSKSEESIVLVQLKSICKETFKCVNNPFVNFLEKNNPHSSLNHVKLIVGPDIDGFAQSATVEQFLGRLYTSGFDLNLEKLYPNVPWPVRAPLISPLIQWKHEHNWYVPKYELKHLNKLFVTIGVDHKDWKFLKGHVVDGRNLFPASAYLVVAWNCYLKLNHLVKDETKIIFRHVRFQRMAVLFKQKPLVLTVELSKTQDKFEIREGDECLVTGTILSVSKNDHYFTRFYEFSLSNSKNVMQKTDVYKKLNLNGYHFKDAFCCIQQVSVDEAIGWVKWSNWTTFLDAMEQFSVVNKNLNELFVPSGIEELVIDPKMHEQALIKHGTTLPIFFDDRCNIISAPGVEIRNMQLSNIKSRAEQEPVLETHKFVPFVTECSLEDSMKIHVQLITENLSNVLSVVEVVDSFSNENFQLLCPVIEKALNNEFRVQSNLSIFSSKSYEDLSIEVRHATVDQIPSDLNLMIVSLGSKRSEEIAGVLKNRNCFVLSREVGSVDSFAGLEVVSVHRTNLECLVLLRNSPDVPRRVIDVDPDFMWLEQLQSSLNNDEKVLLVAQNDVCNGVLGLISCSKCEVDQNVSCMFLLDTVRKFDVDDEFFQKQLRKNLLVNVLRCGCWGSYRHLPLHVVPKDCFQAYCVTNGTDFSNVHYVEGPLSSNQENLVEVYYAGVNFKDVMSGTGKVDFSHLREYRSKLTSLGTEFSGTDSGGRRIMGVTPRCGFSNFISMDNAVTYPVPQEWSLEDAATVPITYLTVLYCFLKVYRLKRGQSVLIHSGTGGIGQSAINVCLHFNCNIFTTVGSEEKRNYLKTLYPSIPDSHVGNSHDSTFEEMILKKTRGKGVDVIINSLSEEKLQSSLRCLAVKGVFLELGKYDAQLNNSLSLSHFSNGRTYVGVHLDSTFEKDPIKLKKIYFLIGEGLKEGYVKPLPRLVYDKDEVQEALRYMSVGKHTSKIVLKFKDEYKDVPRPLQAKLRFFCDSNKVYVIVGGLGGFGLELSDWLIGRGAQNLVLVSTSGATTGYQHFKLRSWRELGCKILLAQDDLTTEKGCIGFLIKIKALGVVDGVFNLSVVLQDALIENQTKETFNAVLAPKALITKNLDAISRRHCPNLRQFVVFSSYACGRGNSGQANYGMANSVAERICEQRKSEGYPALAIQWGLIGDVGLVAEKLTSVQGIEGVMEQKILSCLEVLDVFLTQNEVVVSSAVFDSKKNKKVSKSDDFLNSVVEILSIPNVKHVSMHSTLANLGIDSTSTVQLRHFLGTECNMYLTPRELRNVTLYLLMQKNSDTTN